MDMTIAKEWERSANKILDVSWEFMKSCNVSFDRGFVGELLTLSQLIRTYEDVLSIEGNRISYLGSSIKGHDIQLLLNDYDIKINCKGTTLHVDGKPRWVRQHARKFCTIVPNSHGICKITPREDYEPNFFYVYVDIKKWLDTHCPDFFVLSDEEAKKNFGADYATNYNGEPRRTNDSDDMWVGFSGDRNKYGYDLNQYNDNTLSRFEEYLRKPKAQVEKPKHSIKEALTLKEGEKRPDGYTLIKRRWIGNESYSVWTRGGRFFFVSHDYTELKGKDLKRGMTKEQAIEYLDNLQV
jgi:hypothetical protein